MKKLAKVLIFNTFAGFYVQMAVKNAISAKSKDAVRRRYQIATQRNGCDLERRSNKMSAL